MSDQYFLSRDEDSHWYLVPQDMRQKWDELNHYEDEAEADEFNRVFGPMRINTHPSRVVFTQPEII